MMGMNLSGVLSLLLCWLGDSVSTTISVCLFCPYLVVSTPQVFLYTRSLFTSINFGRLSGVLCLVGGILSVIVEQVYQHLTEKHFKGSPKPILLLHAAVLAAAFLLLLPMGRAAVHKQAELSKEAFRVQSKNINNNNRNSLRTDTEGRQSLLLLPSLSNRPASQTLTDTGL